MKTKKERKKLTPKQKDEIKQRIKRSSLVFLHIVSYILSVLFIIICIVAACQGGCSPKKKSANNSNRPQSNSLYSLNVNKSFTPSPKEESDNMIFYKSDINRDTTYYLNLNFSNYNFLEYFIPSPSKLLSFDETLSDYIVSDNGSDKELYLSLQSYENSQLIGGFSWFGNNIQYLCIFCSYSTNTYEWCVIDENDGYYSLFKWQNNVFVSYLNNQIDNTNQAFDNVFYNYELFDYLFTSKEVCFKFNSYSSPSSIDYLTTQFFAYYLSNYSFDFNSYIFGGNDRYVSFTYLFRRIYNGFFIYCPNQNYIYLEQTLFRGVWEFQNTIYTDISIRLIRAWNGEVDANDPINDGVSQNFRITKYDVMYTNPNPNGNIFFPQIFFGDNQALTNYYFIDEIYMTGVDGQSFTLAYNRVNKEKYTDSSLSPVTFGYNVYCYPSQSLRIFQDDSFLLNNSTEFTLYSIDYDYSFSPNSSIFLTYNYYADFFFTAFVYNGLYHTIKPNSDNTTTIIISPVFDLLTGALIGLLPLFNLQLLPNISFGVLLLLPFVVSIILFVVKLFKR